MARRGAWPRWMRAPRRRRNVEALGARLGAIAAIAETGVEASPLPVARDAMLLSTAGAEMPVEPGDLLVSAAVDVTFQVEQG